MSSIEKSYSKEFKVGIFTLIGILFLLSGVVFFSKAAFQDKGVRYQLVFSFLNGLQQGGSVKYAGGLVIGKILAIEPYGKKAKVIVDVSKTVRVTKNTGFSILGAGLLGEKFVNVDLNNDNTAPNEQEDTAPTLPQDSVIDGKEDVGFDKVIESVSGLAEELSKVAVPLAQIFNDLSQKNTIPGLLEELKRVLKTSGNILADNRHSVYQIFDRISSILDKVACGKGTISAILNDRDMAESFKDTISNLKILIDKLNRNPVIGGSQSRGVRKDFYQQ
jgi:ABC-type transporter Mla subunit MlaD